MRIIHKVTGAQVVKAQLTCALAVLCAPAIGMIGPVTSALAVTAADRFNAMRNLNRVSFMKSREFTTAMLVVLVLSVIALIIVTLYRKLHEVKKQKAATTGGQKIFSFERANNTGENDPQKNLVISTAISAGASNIDQRIANLEKRVGEIENHLTNLEREIASFEVMDDQSSHLQPAVNDEGTK